MVGVGGRAQKTNLLLAGTEEKLISDCQADLTARNML